jgi:hypothetical protein
MNHHTDAAVRASPPEWHAESIDGKYAPTVVDADGAVVALVLAEPWRTAAEAQATARLFAAAPKLLGMAEQARRWAELQSPTAGDTGTFALIAALDHVIALATEGQP